jgi:hypothetical protein
MLIRTMPTRIETDLSWKSTATSAAPMDGAIGGNQRAKNTNPTNQSAKNAAALHTP